MSEHRTVPGVTKVYLRIHEDRLGALIGEGGRVVRDLEARLGVRVTVNSVDSSVIVEPASAYTPASNIIKCQEIIKAIDYCYSYERASRLYDDDVVLLVLDLKDFAGSSESHLQRVKGRIIGEEGRARKTLEEMTGTYISVCRDYVAIIGDYTRAELARQAVEMLAQGRQHSTVYKFLDRALRELKRKESVDIWRKM
ncbi:MAG: KH domain-containing protein [Sulfolobales archaeon]|nr:KH domain-containing protein [Sulfolobales archaeon]MDW8010121.1 KH domain-containing protein [Sulfolobales archaeon]